MLMCIFTISNLYLVFVVENQLWQWKIFFPYLIIAILYGKIMQVMILNFLLFLCFIAAFYKEEEGYPRWSSLKVKVWFVPVCPRRHRSGWLQRYTSHWNVTQYMPNNKMTRIRLGICLNSSCKVFRTNFCNNFFIFNNSKMYSRWKL